MGADSRTIFQEKKSGKNFEDRTTWEELLDHWAKKGDIIIVKNLDRIGRNTKEVRECLSQLVQKEITVESIDQAYSNKFLKEKLLNKEVDSLAEAMLNVTLDTMLEVDLLKAEWERKELKKRQKEGIRRALEKGIKFGRTKNEEFRKKFKEIYQFTRDKDSPKYISVKKAIESIGGSRAMFYKIEKEEKESRIDIKNFYYFNLKKCIIKLNTLK